ncbi:MAG: DUF2520 domain-containing protein [Lachnospiraceae bacterium]
MKIGFIGAGKVGFSMGKYLKEHNQIITGYYSRNPKSALEAADFTNTKVYSRLDRLVMDSEILFLTVPDASIQVVWEKLKQLPIRDKCIVHCSGSLTSAIFSEIDRYSAYGYSIHPLFAISDKYNSYKELSKSLFTIEGDRRYLQTMVSLLEKCGNSVQVIDAAVKVRYHAAAVMASNLIVGLAKASSDLLVECGFSEENAAIALNPLMMGNMEAIVASGSKAALTGPIERNDVETVKRHLKALTGNKKEIYRVISKQLVELAKEKHPETNYDQMKESLL